MTYTCRWCGGDAADGTTCPKAMTCPKCGAMPGASCRRPSGHRADTLHAERIALAESLDPGPQLVGESIAADVLGRRADARARVERTLRPCGECGELIDATGQDGSGAERDYCAACIAPRLGTVDEEERAELDRVAAIDANARGSDEHAGYVLLVGSAAPGEELAVTLGDPVVFDPTGRDLVSEAVVGIVIDADHEAMEPGEQLAPIVRVNGGEGSAQLVVVRRAFAVLTERSNDV